MPSCSLEIEKANFHVPVYIVRVKGALDAYSFPDFEAKIRKLMDDSAKSLILEFSNLEYISSAGLGALMGFAKIARESGGDLVLLKPTPKISGIIDVLGLSKFLKVFNDEKQALYSFVGK